MFFFVIRDSDFTTYTLGKGEATGADLGHAEAAASDGAQAFLDLVNAAGRDDVQLLLLLFEGLSPAAQRWNGEVIAHVRELDGGRQLNVERRFSVRASLQNVEKVVLLFQRIGEWCVGRVGCRAPA